MVKVKQICLDMIKGTYGFFNQKKVNAGFELCGLDFMFDMEGNPFLIEVNYNPS